MQVTVECVVGDGDARVPCGQVPKPSDEPECVQNVQYIYQVSERFRF